MLRKSPFSDEGALLIPEVDFLVGKIRNYMISGFALLFAFLFLWISWLGAKEPYFSGIRTESVVLTAVCILLATGLMSWLGKRSRITLGKKTESILLFLFFCLYLSIQIYIASEMYSRPGAAWDYNIVAGHAMSYGNYKGSDADFVAKVLGKDGQWYYSSWPNNAPLYVFLAYFFRPFAAFGIDLNFVGIGLNIFCIDLSLLLLYYAVKYETGSVSSAWISLFLACLHGALLIYVPIYYTDTLTLPCAIGTLLLTQRGRKTEKSSDELLMYGASAAVLAIGSVLKFSVVVALIAEIITELITQPIRKSLRRIAVVLAVFLILYLALQAACLNAPIVVVDKEISYIPKLHWVMMGLSGNGDYNDADYQMTVSVPAESRDAFVRMMILQRIKDYGFSGMLRHLHEKIAFVWGEGTYFSSVKIDRCRAKASWLDKYVNYLGEDFLPYASFEEGVMAFVELMLAISGLYLFFSKEKDPDLVLAEISVFGLFLFECLWEARSRYLFNFLPVFIFIAAVMLRKIATIRKNGI